MSKMKRGVTIPSVSVCSLCQYPSDEKKFGKFFISKRQGFAVHEYCVFFSAGLPQNGGDNDDFQGYLEKDIMKELRRARRLRCRFCHKHGASAGCCIENCRKVFHFPCGEQQNCLFQYFGEFRAFCCEHRPRQNVSTFPSRHSKFTTCAICLEKVPCHPSPDTLKTPCCKDTWFHRSCVRNQALVSGYFFRCAVCNDDKKFIKEMKEMGIYIPDRDAAWEEGENFADLLHKYNRCDIVSCKCPFGSTFSADGGPWELVLCSSCGQYGAHVGCKSWCINPPLLFCPTCQPVHLKMESLKPTSGSVSLTRRSSRLAGDQAISISDDQTSDTSGGTVRKYGQRRRMKRTRQACDDEVDDIFLHLNGLKRTASEDFHGLDLNSDTKLALHKALAAGTAVKEYSNRGKLDKSAKGLYLSNNMGNKNGRESGHVLSNSEDGDDDCVITKYVPSCAICPTCHRRKPMKNINVRPASEAPKRSSLRSTPNVPTSSVKPAPAGRNRFIGNQVNVTDDLSRPPFMESLESKVIISISKQNSEKGFEAIERATQDINKSSVLLVSPSSHDNQSSLGVTANTSDQVTTQKISSSDQQAVGDIIENFTSQSSSTRGSASVHTSFFTSSVQKIVQLLSPPTSETTLQHSQGAVTSLHRLGDVPQQPDEDELPSEVKMSVLPMPKASPSSSKVNHELPNDYLKSNEVSGFPFPFRTPAVEKTQNEFAQLSVSHPSASLLKDSQTETEVDSKSSVAGLHVTTLTFSKSDPKKTVFEAALDHGYQLRSSGSAMIHQCLASY